MHYDRDGKNILCGKKRLNCNNEVLPLLCSPRTCETEHRGPDHSGIHTCLPAALQYHIGQSCRSFTGSDDVLV